MPVRPKALRMWFRSHPWLGAIPIAAVYAAIVAHVSAHHEPPGSPSSRRAAWPAPRRRRVGGELRVYGGVSEAARLDVATGVGSSPLGQLPRRHAPLPSCPPPSRRPSPP